MEQCDTVFRQRFRQEPDSVESLFYFLGDRFEWAITWSGVSKRLPCFRKNQAKYLHRPSMRFLSGQEKLCALGWPVNRPIANSMLTTPMPSVEGARSDFLAGNSMHVSNASVCLLLALVCWGPKVCTAQQTQENDHVEER